MLFCAFVKRKKIKYTGPLHCMLRMFPNKDTGIGLWRWLLEKETQLLRDSIERKFSFYFILFCTFCYYSMCIFKNRTYFKYFKKYMKIFSYLSWKSGAKGKKQVWSLEGQGSELGNYQSGGEPESWKQNLRPKSRNINCLPQHQPTLF